MIRFLRILGLCVALFPGCVVLALTPEKKPPECGKGSFENIKGKKYTLIRSYKGKESQDSFKIHISETCEVDVQKDLTPLGVKAFTLRDPKSSSGAILVLDTIYETPAGEPVSCSAPLAEFESLEFLCPRAKSLTYALVPRE
jgi:hypothetical protein